MIDQISLLRSLVKINTQSNFTNLPLIYLIEKILKKNGFKIKIQKIRVGTVEKANLIARIGEGSGGFLFSGHTDTVPPGDNWQSNPFQLTKKGDRYYGLGAVDVKGFLAAAIVTACQATELRKVFKKPLSLVFTFDEETDFLGIKKLLSNGLIKDKPDLVIVGEPTKMQPVFAHKGVIGIRIKIYGKEAHSSNPDLGVNAIEEMAELINALKKLAINFRKHKDPIFNPSYSTFNISKIEGGSVINKVPDFCSLELECRPISRKLLKEIFQQIQQTAKQFRKTKRGLKIEIEKIFEVPPLELSSTPRMISKVKNLTSKKPLCVSYSTEASIYSKYNIPAIVMGPGDIKRAHRPNEFITKNELDRAVSTYQKLIQKYCLGGHQDLN